MNIRICEIKLNLYFKCIDFNLQTNEIISISKKSLLHELIRLTLLHFKMIKRALRIYILIEYRTY